MPDTLPPNPIFTDAATENVLTTFFEKMPLLGVGLDTNGIVKYVNPYLLTVTGYTRDELIGKNWFETVIPKQLQLNITSTFADIIAKGTDTRYENAILTKTGEIRQVSWTNAVLKDASGKPAGTLSIGEDVTSLKNAVESLLESEERFRILSEVAQEGIAIHDNGIMILCNQKLAEMSGYTVEEMVGKHVLDFFPQESKEIVSKHLNEETAGCYRVIAHKKDGSTPEIEICGKMMQYQGRRVRVTTIQELPVPQKAS